MLGVLSLLFWVGCNKEFTSPDNLGQDPELLTRSNPEVLDVINTQNRNQENLMSRQGVVGVATGATEAGEPVILIMVKDETSASLLPPAVDGVPIVVLVTGEIKALKGPPGGSGGGGGPSFDPTIKHRPAPNGVSIGHPDITAGTLGCIVADAGKTYILSNNHVMANENQASINDDIYQPGPYDGGQASDAIARLSAFKPIVFSTSANNVIDAAIAEVNSADVTGATHPDANSYGAPLSTTVEAAIRMQVQKYGRTTQHTSGKVQGINATVNIGYDSGTARFVNQIVIGGGNYSAGGDSGSLIVAQKGQDDRKPVGLLYAGGFNVTIANPIDDILSEFSVQVVSGIEGSN